MGGLRASLNELRPQSSTHAGLWLERYIVDVAKDGEKQGHISATLGTLRVPDGYSKFFERWSTHLAALDPATVCREVRARGRFVVGLGGESVLETAVTLHRTWGVPYLPGTALKGLASRYAARRLVDVSWKKEGPSHRVLFGEQEDAGHVDFHDALWIPKGTELPLDLDVMTVHHPEYYQGKEVPPADWDSPVPVPFVSARGSYLLAATGPKAWAEAAIEILVAALDEEGVGAKTSAGYGRMTASGASGPATGTAPLSKADEWSEVVKRIQPGDAAQRVPSLLGSLSGTAKREAARAIVQKLGPKWLRDRKEKPWVAALLDAAEAKP
jgi:CRISPR-associated protein Cmr6